MKHWRVIGYDKEMKPVYDNDFYGLTSNHARENATIDAGLKGVSSQIIVYEYILLTKRGEV